jgi:hypothetical protein
MAIKLTVVIIETNQCYQLHTIFQPTFDSQGYLQMKLLEIISMGFDITDQLLMRLFLHLSDTGEKCEYNETVHQLLVGFKKACDSIRKGSIVQYSPGVWGTHETS